MKTLTKPYRKPKTYSVENIFNFYAIKLLKENPSYFMTGKGETGQILSYTGEELSYINKMISVKRLELGELNKEVNSTINSKSTSLTVDVLDLQAALKAFEIRKKELENTKLKVKLIIDYKTFKKVLTTYNTKAGQKIIEGKKLNLLNNLGYLGARVVERNHNNKAINWGETNKLRNKDGNLPIGKDGKAIKVYFIDDDWIRIGWIKTSGIYAARNMSVYAFTPAAGQVGKGYKQTFSKAQRDNPELRLKYDYFEYRSTGKSRKI